MSYHYKAGVVTPFAQKYIKIIVAGMLALTLVATMALRSVSSAAPLSVNGCNFNQVGNVWKLLANCTATAQINLPAGTRLNGNNKTIKAGFDFTSNSNNAVLGIIDSSNVKVKDMVIDGNGRTALHGINVYQSIGVYLDEVTTKNNQKNGLVVNGSEVTVKDITTANNTWGGINVDQGVDVTKPGILTVKGKSTHTDLGHIYIDNVTRMVQVNDVRNQYTFSHPAVFGRPFDRLYTLKPVTPHHDDDDHDD